MDALEKINSLTEKTKNYLASFENFVVDNPDNLKKSNEIVRDIQSKIKELEGLKKDKLEPIKAKESEVKKYFAVPLGMLEMFKNSLSEKMLAYSQAERLRIAEEAKAKEAEAQAKRDALQEQAQEALLKGEVKKASTLMTLEQMTVARHEEPTKLDGSYIKTDYKARIVDISKVPEAYLMPRVANVKALEAYAKATKAQGFIEGVEFYVEENLITRKF